MATKKATRQDVLDLIKTFGKGSVWTVQREYMGKEQTAEIFRCNGQLVFEIDHHNQCFNIF